MEFSHAGNNGLARLLIRSHFKGRIFQGQSLQGGPQFFKIALGVGFNRYGDTGFREGHRFKDDRFLFTADRISRRCMFQAHRGKDISGRDLLNLLPLVGMHLQETPDPFSFPFRSIED